MNRTRTTRLTATAAALATAVGLAVAAPSSPARAAAADDAADAQAAVDAVALVHPDDVRGNLTLPTSGGGATLSWASAEPDVVTPSGEVTRPSHGRPAEQVDLTVSAEVGAETRSRVIPVTVTAAPAPMDYEAYAFSYFEGESTDDGESIYFGASTGNDPLDYDVLNDGQPVLSSQFGTRGLRDPFLIRSAEGDRFWLLATDLKAYPEVDFGEAQETGSKYLEVWESTDLVTWSAQRHVKVSSDFAGNTWAPEAFYDEAAGEYVVYWASALYPSTDTEGRDIGTSYQRMMYVTTRDFVTFSEPQPWIDVRRGAGRGIIDVTVVKDGDTYQRVLKDEATFTPRQEASTDLRATVSGSLPTTTSSPGWRLVKERIGSGQPNPWGGTFSQGEGPTIFPDNEVPGRWYLFIDQPSYHGGRGYVAFRTDNLAAADWQSVPTAELPSEPRHGTVIPVTQEELDRLRRTYQPELLVESVEDVAVSTRQGVAPVLPATVPATLADGTSDDVGVRWDDVPPSAYAAPGTFTVEGTVVSGSADRPVATVRVGDSLDPVVRLSDHDGWSTTDPVTVSVSATDETGVDSLETAVDDEAFDSTDGDEAEVVVTGDGVHTVRARAVDVTGNRSAVTETTVRIDATDPVSRADVTGTGARRQVVVRAADAASGVDRVEVRRDGETAWRTYDGPEPVGTRWATVRYRAVDVAGNVETTRTLTVPAAQSPPLRTSLVASAPSRVRHGTRFGVSVRVTGPDGPVAGVVRVFDGRRQVGVARLVDGRRVVRVGPLPVGRHVLVVRYDGSARYRAAQDRVVVVVTRR